MALAPEELSIRLLQGWPRPRHLGTLASARRRSRVGRIDLHVTPEGHLIRAARRFERLSIVLGPAGDRLPDRIEAIETISLEEFSSEVVVDRPRWRVFLFGKIYRARSPEDYQRLDRGIAATTGETSLHHHSGGSESRTMIHLLTPYNAFIVESYRTFPAHHALVTTHLRLDAR
jgi:hypothetical protein